MISAAKLPTHRKHGGVLLGGGFVLELEGGARRVRIQGLAELLGRLVGVEDEHGLGAFLAGQFNLFPGGGGPLGGRSGARHEAVASFAHRLPGENQHGFSLYVQARVVRIPFTLDAVAGKHDFLRGGWYGLVDALREEVPRTFAALRTRFERGNRRRSPDQLKLLVIALHPVGKFNDGLYVGVEKLRSNVVGGHLLAFRARIPPLHAVGGDDAQVFGKLLGRDGGGVLPGGGVGGAGRLGVPQGGRAEQQRAEKVFAGVNKAGHMRKLRVFTQSEKANRRPETQSFPETA
jgi:hypothetical protein